MFGFRLLLLCALCISAAGIGYIEQQQWWTLRFSISRFLNGWLLLAITLGVTIQLMIDIVRVYNDALVATRAMLAMIVIGTSFFMFRVLLPLAQNSDYIRLRWKAWTGPSRTGIAPRMTRYLGEESDWRSLASISKNIRSHPVEISLSWSRAFFGGISYDPTDLLNARLGEDEKTGTTWTPRSESKAGVYAPAGIEDSVSLLWGENLGFIRRCSRGIMAVPRPLLNFHPTLKNGVDGRPLCLAHGILARNKGLEPYRLVCNLQTPSRLRIFEENSSLWPRPAKTLRSFYHAEMSKAFSGLGEAFVCVATELALLLADAQAAIVADWLDAHLEQQDLSLNNQAAALGASTGDLDQLYRGQYVAMLVSLSEHQVGFRARPELLVFGALSTAEGRSDFTEWLNVPSMRERALQERAQLGVRGMRLVEAAV